MSQDYIGRPLKLTPQRQAIIVKGISLGLTYKLASQAAEMSYHTFNRYMNLGAEQAEQEHGDEYYYFYHAVKKAEAKRATRWLELIDLAAGDSKQWTAAAWKLERCHREDYSKDAVELQKIQEMYEEIKKMCGKENDKNGKTEKYDLADEAQENTAS